MPADATTTRLDPSGCEHVAALAGPPGARLFVTVHRPGAPGRTGVVVCGSVGSEFLKNYRRESMLGRALAARGVPTVRFHYRGTGHSEGEPEAISLDSMIADATEAANLLRSWGTEEVAFVGTRIGALVAVRAAASASSVALWDPVIAGDDAWRDALRGRAMRALKEGGEPARPVEAEMHERRVADVLGWTVGRSLYDSVRAASIAVPPAGLRAAFVAQIGRERRLRPSVTAFVDGWRAAGVDVRTHIATWTDPWWLISHTAGTVEGTPENEELVAATAAFLAVPVPTEAAR